jgi:hypothetical protein
MVEIPMQQVYDLALSVLREFDEIDASLDGILSEMRKLNRHISLTGQSFSKASSK